MFTCLKHMDPWAHCSKHTHPHTVRRIARGGAQRSQFQNLRCLADGCGCVTRQFQSNRLSETVRRKTPFLSASYQHLNVVIETSYCVLWLDETKNRALWSLFVWEEKKKNTNKKTKNKKGHCIQRRAPDSDCKTWWWIIVASRLLCDRWFWVSCEQWLHHELCQAPGYFRPKPRSLCQEVQTLPKTDFWA